ncbi:NlpC/P60 family protein [Rhodococcus sp. 27YEA15]|uniref:NlpC/P60 family protein n=1 Tax=Rhodococcus sp. 27YEA15 TaxID=3156259 RepID=UPI003C7C79E0
MSFRGIQVAVGLGLVSALIVVTPAAAVPPPPPNPSDADISAADSQVSAGVGTVSALINEVAAADQQLSALDDDVAVKREEVNKSLVDLQNARSAADAAAQAVTITKQALQDASAQIEVAQNDFDKYARSSYVKGTNTSSITSFLDAKGPADVLDRAQVLKLLANTQSAVLDGLQRARTEQANRDSATRQAKQQADAAAEIAANLKDLAEQAIAVARNALAQQVAKKASIEAERNSAQAQLDAARNAVAGLQNQRQAYATWDEQRRAEEAHQAALEAAAKEAAVQAAARAAADQAAKDRAAALAAAQRPHTAVDDPDPTVIPDIDVPSIPGTGGTTVTTPTTGNSAPAAPTTGNSAPAAPTTTAPTTAPVVATPKPTTTTVAPKPSTPSVTGGAAIESVIDRGMSQLGVQYAWGGGNENGPTKGIRDGGVADSYGDFNKVGFDCSGLMIYAFAGIGISLPHYTGYQYTAGKQVPSSEMKRGDMIFYGPNASQHVALYLGNGQMLEAPQSGSSVKVSPVRWGGMTPYVVRMVS